VRRRALGLLIAAAALIATAWLAPSDLRAETAVAAAQELSDGAFALLNLVNAQAGKDAPLLGPVANLAADAQSLASAENHGDRSEAGHAMAAVVADEHAIEDANGRDPGHLDASKWNALKSQIDALQAQVPPVKGPLASAAPKPAASPAAAASGPPAIDTSAQADAPRVVINSRVYTGGTVRVKGYLEGVNLKSAGIYDGPRQLRPLDVGMVSGSQRLNFDLGLESAGPGETIRVTDGYGRTAEARVAPDVAVATAPNSDAHDKMIELGSGVAEADSGSAGINVPEPRNNTAEIPRSAGDVAPEHPIPGGVGHLRDVQINVIGVTALPSQPGTYEVVGQIAGGGVHRAGVYVNGRLARPIPITSGGYSAFDVTFTAQAGDATIRAYGAGNDFIEASIDMSDNGMTVYNGPPAYPPYPAYPPPYGNPYNPYGYPANPYGAANPYARPYPYGYPPPAYGTPPPSRPWYKRLF
jgi:hypothetical protein